MTAPIRQVRAANFSPDCCGAGAAGAGAAYAAGVEAAAACLVGAGAASRLDTIAAPTRQVRAAILEEEGDFWGATAAVETAAAGADADTAGLGPAEGSRLDIITAPIRHVRVANLSSPQPCSGTGAGEAPADDDGAHELDGEVAADAAAAAAAGLGADEASGLDTMTAPIRQVRAANFSPDCCGAGAAGAGAADADVDTAGDAKEAGAEAPAACLVGAGAASRLDTIAAPTRQVRAAILEEEEDCWGATAADGTAAAGADADTAGLGPADGSRLDIITAPIRHVRASNLSSPRPCTATGAGEAPADDDG